MTESLLEGVRVLDLGWVWAGAVCGSILAEWGADVIKIESSARLDPGRQGRPIVGDVPDPEQNPLFHNANRRKRSVSINLQQPKGRELVRRLAKVSDVVIENMTPHALGALELDYTVLSSLNPGIVMVSYPLAGAGGPFSELRGYGPTAGSLVGLDNLMGYDDQEKALGFHAAIADPLVGIHAATSVLAALRQRHSTGRGMHIDMSMVECLVSCMSFGLLQYQLNGDEGAVRENRHQIYAPYGVYPCQFDNEESEAWIAIAVDSDEEWRALCVALGLPFMVEDRRFADNFARRQHRRELDAIISNRTKDWDRFDLESVLQQVGVAGTACLGPQDRYLDEHLKLRKTYEEVEHPVLGSEPLHGNPIHFADFEPVPMTRAPLLGEHTDEVLSTILDLSAGQIETLRSEKVLV